jgi:omega-amidase
MTAATPQAPRIAIAQIRMHWTTAENLAAIRAAMRLAARQGAAICAFSELAVTGFHREIAREVASPLQPALEGLFALAAKLGLAIAVGAPILDAAGRRFIAQLLIDSDGCQVACVTKRGLTDPEATFFDRGTARPIGKLQGLRCSAVICREVEDHAEVARQLPPGSTDLIFVPGALKPHPDRPRTDPPEYVQDLQRLARHTGAWVAQTNWPNALNRPEESIDGGASAVVSPEGELVFRLPPREAGVGVFRLGERRFEWYPE